MPFTFHETALPGVTVIEADRFTDARGFFMETYRRSEFLAAGIGAAFVQENQSKSVHGTLRGLHWQRSPKAQAKLIRVLQGEIFDVAVDIRRGSPTFGRWSSIVLSGGNGRSVFVPAGYAHGFCVTSADAEVLYSTTEEYAPELECGLRWDDPALNIPWPLSTPLLSDRDRRWPTLRDLP